MTNKQSEQQYAIGMVGLGVMGRNFLLNMADHGFLVAGYDKDQPFTSVSRIEEASTEVIFRVISADPHTETSDSTGVGAGLTLSSLLPLCESLLETLPYDAMRSLDSSARSYLAPWGERTLFRFALGFSFHRMLVARSARSAATG